MWQAIGAFNTSVSRRIFKSGVNRRTSHKTIPNTTPPKGNIYALSKTAVTWEIAISFEIYNAIILCNIVFVMTGNTISTVWALQPRKARGGRVSAIE